jgi:hypothetical protein
MGKMQNRDYIRVVIRLFGVYLLIQAVIAIPALAGAILHTYDYCVLSNPSTNESLERGLRTALKTDLVRSGLAVTLYGLIGIYFTFGGELVHRWICRSGEPGD